jgi:hypothetical protein
MSKTLETHSGVFEPLLKLFKAEAYDLSDA